MSRFRCKNGTVQRPVKSRICVSKKTKTKTRTKNKTKHTKKEGKSRSKSPVKLNPTKQKTKQLYHNTIQKFMKNTTLKRQSHFLQNICSDVGMCIAFGLENNKIRNFFHGFTSFEFVVPPIKSIGVVSVNGFIKEISYQNLNYTANAILKSSIRYISDNLAYEYMVGMQINKWTKYFPCFVETYGLYKYKTRAQYETIKSTESLDDVNILKDSLYLISTSNSIYEIDDFGELCQDSKYYAILIQHIKNAQGLAYMHRYENLSMIMRCSIYAQIYFVLGRLTNDFVHNDLHGNNVMLYSPAPGKYIYFHYHFEDGTEVSFKSYFVAKMIDYGRCYIKSSKGIHDELCKVRECMPKCGYNYGFGAMQDTLNIDNYYISSIIRNPSADLWLLHILDKNIYGISIQYDEAKLKIGTKPIETSGTKDKKINNVEDASKLFQSMMRLTQIIDFFNGPMFPENNKFADLHVYMNMTTPMKFIKV